jgi:TRAP-type C4-dicarboxylate transport system permease small subunit
VTAVPDGTDGLHMPDAAPPGAGPLERLCEFLCALALVAMIGLIGAEAVARNLFNFSLQLADEVGGYLLVAVSFLSLAVAQAHGAYHRVELVQARLSRRARLASGILFDLAALAASGILTWQLARLCLNSWRAEDVAPTPLLTPLWLPQLVMPIGTALVCVTLARTVLVKVRRIRQEPRS